MTDDIVANMIRVENPDAPIYRIDRLERVRALFEHNELTLIAPHLWDDPFENVLTKCAIEYESAPERRQTFFDRLRKPIFAQCWSRHQESDVMWRAYSTVIKDPVTTRNQSRQCEGVQLRTTPTKLLSAMWNACASDPTESCFLGAMRYALESDIMRFVANEVARLGTQAFGDSRGHAESILFKRKAFFGELEIRLVYVDWRGTVAPGHKVAFSVDGNALFDEIVLDPRLSTVDVQGREEELRGWGYTGSVRRSSLYQNKLFQIRCP